MRPMELQLFRIALAIRHPVWCFASKTCVSWTWVCSGSSTLKLISKLYFGFSVSTLFTKNIFIYYFSKVIRQMVVCRFNTLTKYLIFIWAINNCKRQFKKGFYKIFLHCSTECPRFLIIISIENNMLPHFTKNLLLKYSLIYGYQTFLF